MKKEQSQLTIHSIGHSNRSYLELARLLKSAGIETVIDCRTRPYSRWPQFNSKRLQASLEADGMRYEFRGTNLGGYGENEAEDETLDELTERAASGERLALLCSEGDFRNCHRGTRLAPALEARGVNVRHLLHESAQRSLM